MHQQLLSHIDSPHLAPLIVWTPRYPGDCRAAAQSMMEEMPDQRGLHFWDEQGLAGNLLAGCLELPEQHDFAWDVYLVFRAAADWSDALPASDFWMHQLSKKPPWLANRFNVARLRQIVSDHVRAGS